MRVHRRLRPLGGAFIFSFLVLFSAILIVGCSGSGESDGKAAVVNAVGAQAVDFTIKTFDGGQFTLSTHAGSPVLINFWASWCGPCRLEGPLLESLYNRYKSQGLVFVGIAIQDSEKGSRKYLKKFGWTFPSGPDSDDSIANAYNVRGIPKTLILNRDGTVSYIQSGVMPEGYLAAKIDEVLGQ